MRFPSRREALTCGGLVLTSPLTGCAPYGAATPTRAEEASTQHLETKDRRLKVEAASIDAAIEAALKAFGVPGAVVGIVSAGQIVYLKGHGAKALGKDDPLTPDSLFAIASCTKAFTTTALAMLVAEGKLHWDQPVRDVLDYFRLADPSADRLVTIRDLVCHRTGLGTYDLLWYRAPWNQREAIRRIAKLAPELQFRSSFQYQSTMVAAAGYAAAEAGKQPWEDFVQKRILDPLEMRRTFLTTAVALKQPDLAMPHRRDRKDAIHVTDWYVMREPDPAGSIASCASDLCKWAIFHLSGGTVEHDGKQTRLVAEAALEETHTPQNHIPLKGTDGKLHPVTLFMSYCMGWVRQDYHGRLLLSHAGTIDGFRTHITLLPREQVGIVLLNNLHGSDMNLALSNTLVDQMLDLPRRNWNAHVRAVGEERDKPIKERPKLRAAMRKQNAPPSHELAAYQGEYVEPVFGSAKVTLQDGKLTWEWSTFKVALEHYHYDTFIGHHEILNDPVISFSLGFDGQVLTMNALDRYFVRMR
jgi:CubicO group peptidase (beta-lactamase class C family)